MCYANLGGDERYLYIHTDESFQQFEAAGGKGFPGGPAAQCLQCLTMAFQLRSWKPSMKLSLKWLVALFTMPNHTGWFIPMLGAQFSLDAATASAALGRAGLRPISRWYSVAFLSPALLGGQ